MSFFWKRKEEREKEERRKQKSERKRKANDKEGKGDVHTCDDLRQSPPTQHCNE